MIENAINAIADTRTSHRHTDPYVCEMKEKRNLQSMGYVAGGWIMCLVKRISFFQCTKTTWNQIYAWNQNNRMEIFLAQMIEGLHAILSKKDLLILIFTTLHFIKMKKEELQIIYILFTSSIIKFYISTCWVYMLLYKDKYIYIHTQANVSITVLNHDSFSKNRWAQICIIH